MRKSLNETEGNEIVWVGGFWILGNIIILAICVSKKWTKLFVFPVFYNINNGTDTDNPNYRKKQPVIEREANGFYLPMYRSILWEND